MLRRFLTITFRVLWRNKVTSFVNILSLSIGITAFIFIMLYVYHETNYDKFNEHYENIYRLEVDDYAKLPPSIGIEVLDKIPEVKSMTRLSGGYGTFFLTYVPEENPEDFKQVPLSCYWGDSTTFEVFTFPLIRGDSREALKGPSKVVLSESAAKKLFDDADPMMKSVEYQDHSFLVSGIMK